MTSTGMFNAQAYATDQAPLSASKNKSDYENMDECKQAELYSDEKSKKGKQLDWSADNHRSVAKSSTKQ